MSPMVLSGWWWERPLLFFLFWLFLITVPVGETQRVEAENSIPAKLPELKYQCSHLSPRQLIKSFRHFRVDAFHHRTNSLLIHPPRN